MEEIKFTEQEKIILKVMFQNMRNVIDSCDEFNINYACFDKNDLFYLAEKLGISNY